MKSQFLRESGRQFGNCSQNYAGYAVERLEICITNVSHLKDHLENGVALFIIYLLIRPLQVIY